MINPKVVLRTLYCSRTVGIYTNTSCNCQCKMCGIWKLKRKNLPIEKARKAIDILSLKKFNFLFLAGGETFLYPHLFDLINHATNRGMLTQVLTNGTIMNGKIAERLKESGVGMIAVSVDSQNPKKAEEIRMHENILGKIENTVKVLKSKSIVTTAETVVSRYNYKELDKIVDFVNNDLKIPISFSYPLQSDGFYPLGDREKVVSFSNEELIAVFEKIFDLKKSGSNIINTYAYIREVIRKLENLDPIFMCRAGKDILTIDYDGIVRPCFYEKEICTVDELENIDYAANYKPCDKCLAECFREPSILADFVGRFVCAREALENREVLKLLVKRLLK